MVTAAEQHRINMEQLARQHARDRTIVQLASEQVPISKIAYMYDLSLSRVRHIIADAKREPLYDVSTSESEADVTTACEVNTSEPAAEVTPACEHPVRSLVGVSLVATKTNDGLKGEFARIRCVKCNTPGTLDKYGVHFEEAA